MKVGFIFVLYKTPTKEVKRLNKEVKKLNLSNSKLYFINNTFDNKGYSYGVNKGLKRAIKDECDIFVIANFDISLHKIKAKNLLEPAKFFHVWGFTMQQNGKNYYGGEIDKWRMSGGLITKKPKKRFVEREFVSGSLICIKKEVIDTIGFWDERYFLYYEDVDYCLRAKRAGFKIGIDRDSVYDHLEHSQKNPLKNYYLRNNRLRFLLKHGSITQKLYELVRLPKSILENRQGFLFNFLSLNASSFINKLFAFTLFLFLIRYLSVKDYGIYTLIWVQIALLAPFADLGTTNYGILESSFGKSEFFRSLFSLRTAIATLVWIFTILLAFLLRFNQKIIFLILFASPIIFSNAFSGSLLILSSLKRKVYLPSIISIIFNALLTGTLIGALIFKGRLQTLFIVTGVLYIGYAIINILFLKKETKQLYFFLDFVSWLSILKKSFIFVLISFFAGLYFKLDVFLLNFLKGSESVGVYSAGYKFFEALLFIPASYNIVSIPLLSQLYSGSKPVFFERIKRDFILLFIFGMLLSIILSFLAPILFSFLLKGDFSDGSRVFQIVIYAFPPILLSSIMFNALYIFKKAYVVLYLFLFQVVFNIFFNVLFIPKYSYIASSYITVYGEFLNLILVTLLFKYFYKREYRS